MVAVGVGLDGVDEFGRIAPVLEPLERDAGVPVGVLLVVEVVQKPGAEPEVGVLAIVGGVALHRSADHQGVQPLVFIADMLVKQGGRGGLVSGQGHGSAAGGDDGLGLDHENDGALRGAGAVHDALGDDDALARPEGDRAALEVDMKEAFDDVEEFVVRIVLVPVVFALDDADAHDGVVDEAQRLVEPLVRDRVGEGLFVDQLKRREPDVEPRDIGVGLGIAHARSPAPRGRARNTGGAVPVDATRDCPAVSSAGSHVSAGHCPGPAGFVWRSPPNRPQVRP